MFSVSDIKRETYRAAYRRGKELYESGAVSDFTYDVYLEDGRKMAELSAKVRGQQQDHYQVTATVDEEFADVNQCDCECEAFYNYSGFCKHCVAVLLAYVNRRQAGDFLKIGSGGAERTEPVFKNLLNQYSMRAESAYLIPNTVHGRVELEPHFKLFYGYATVEFKIGVEQKYVLKNITAFLDSVGTNECVRYGKKLEFYHHKEAFTEESWRLVEFLQQQNEDKKRQSMHHAYYAHSGGYERTMELDEVGIDRFFAAVGTVPFFGELGYHCETFYQIAEEEKRPGLSIRAEGSGIFLRPEELATIRGRKRFYFCEENVICKSSERLRDEACDIFDYLEKHRGGECYIAAEELPMFCRDLLPLLREVFQVSAEGFDESLYVPKKPEFELYLDRQDADVVGAKLMAVYGEEKCNALEPMEPGDMRDISEETRIRSLVEPYFNGYDTQKTVFALAHDEEKLYQLLTGGLQRLSEYMTIFTSGGFRNMKVVSSPKVSVGVALKSDLLELQIHSEEIPSGELAYLLTKYDRRKKYIRLKNGDFLDIRDDGIGALAEVSQDLRLTETDLKKGRIRLPKYRAMYMDAALKSNHTLSIEKNREFKGMVRNMKTIEDSDFEVPESLKTVMRSYQKTGFLWLKTLRENGFGGILADDMGLGKTLQVISLLLSEQQEVCAGQKEAQRALIVCPASLVYNWQKEIARFAPELTAVAITGLASERGQSIKNSKNTDILITSYDLLKRDVAWYDDMVFSIQVIDEAQYIKNPGTQAARSVKRITAAFKLALTGTPIENRLSELWSIFDYLMPGFLYTYQRFRKEMEIPIVANQDENRMERLKRMIRPFVLRRLKGDVLTELPEKLEENVFARMEGEQLSLYDAHVQQLRQMLENKSEKEFNTEKIQILAELTKLRQICCDPALLYEGYTGTSAKMDMCMELIQNAVTGGHKVLLFSQFTSMLDRLAADLKKEGIAYHMLNGAVNKEKRMQMVESFDNDDVPVFCISLKAGGTGLNLTAADIVIHYDPWWNIAVQNQATDRAHRIGQKNVVTVYKLVSEGTIEEKILAIQERKKELASQVLEGEGMDSAFFTKEEILELL